MSVSVTSDPYSHEDGPRKGKAIFIWASYLVYKMGVLVTGANWQWDELTANRQFRINFRFKISRIVLQ